jgi:hypothetical protein
VPNIEKLLNTCSAVEIRGTMSDNEGGTRSSKPAYRRVRDKLTKREALSKKDWREWYESVKSEHVAEEYEVPPGYVKTSSGMSKDLATKTLWKIPPGFAQMANRKFISDFWKSTFYAMGTKLLMSTTHSSFHGLTAGQIADNALFSIAKRDHQQSCSDHTRSNHRKHHGPPRNRSFCRPM